MFDFLFYQKLRENFYYRGGKMSGDELEFWMGCADDYLIVVDI